MAEAYALHEGAFGTAIVLEARANLVAHAHSETQLALWLGGARACAHVGAHVVPYGENVALGVNAFEAHDMVRLDDNGACLFLVFMLKKEWLESLGDAKGRSFRFPSPHVPISAAMRRSCWRVLDLIISAYEARRAVDDEVERLLEAAIAASATGEGAAPAGHGIESLDQRLRAAIAHMRAHVAEKASVDDIAAMVGLSRALLHAVQGAASHHAPGLLERRAGGRGHAPRGRRPAAHRRGAGPRLLEARQLLALLQGTHGRVPFDLQARDARSQPGDGHRHSARVGACRGEGGVAHAVAAQSPSHPLCPCSP